MCGIDVSFSSIGGFCQSSKKPDRTTKDQFIYLMWVMILKNEALVSDSLTKRRVNIW